MIDIIIPTYKRAHRLASVIDNIHENTTVEHRILFVVEPEDLDSIHAVLGAGERVMISEIPGNHTGAANTGYKYTHGEYIIIANDDFVFMPEWDTKAIEALSHGWQVCGLNDMGGGDRCVTIFLFKRSYIVEQSGCMDVPNVVFYPGYNHQYVDTEFWETAERRRVFARCPESRIEHMHPGFGKASTDETYGKANSKAEIDAETYRSRRHLWA